MRNAKKITAVLLAVLIFNIAYSPTIFAIWRDPVVETDSGNPSVPQTEDEIKATEPDLIEGEEDINKALYQYGEKMRSFTNGLWIVGLATGILGLLLQVTRLALFSRNPRWRSFVMIGIGESLIVIGVLGGWTFLVYAFYHFVL